MAGLIWLSSVKNLEVKHIKLFSYRRFSLDGESYLFHSYGEEVAKIQIKNSRISDEIKLAKEFVNKVITEQRIPSSGEIKSLLNLGYLVICTVNLRVLKNTEGYSGHFILIKGYTANSFIVHDPGLPAYENKEIEFSLFDKAWS